MSDSENMVYPKSWREAYEHLKRRLVDSSAPDVSFRDIPPDTSGLSIDEIVAAQPMTAPVEGLEIVWASGKDPKGVMYQEASVVWKKDDEKT